MSELEGGGALVKVICLKGCGAEFAHEGARDFHMTRCKGKRLHARAKPVVTVCEPPADPATEAAIGEVAELLDNGRPTPDEIDRGPEEAEKPMANTVTCKCGKVYNLRGRGKAYWEKHERECDGTPKEPKAARSPRTPRAAKRKPAASTSTGARSDELREMAKEIRREADIKASALEELANEAERLEAKVEEALAGKTD